MKLHPAVVFAFVAFSAANCSELDKKTGDLIPLIGAVDVLRVTGSIPFPGQQGVATTTRIGFSFSKDIDVQKCISAFAISPSVAGGFNGGGTLLEFIPNAALTPGTYVATLSRSCEDTSGRDLEAEYTASFGVGVSAASITPEVQAVGLASQGCALSYPGTGSAAGGDHTLGTCWWDSSLAILSPTAYEFRGDNACADVNTDNIRIIFNTYMNIGATINAISVTRQSPPSSSVKKASWVWSDCLAAAPFGCRVVTIAFTEEANACGGAGFGGNDFNLQQDTPLADFPFYLLEVDGTAVSFDGLSLPATFTFGFEGD